MHFLNLFLTLFTGAILTVSITASPIVAGVTPNLNVLEKRKAKRPALCRVQKFTEVWAQDANICAGDLQKNTGTCSAEPWTCTQIACYDTSYVFLCAEARKASVPCKELATHVNGIVDDCRRFPFPWADYVVQGQMFDDRDNFNVVVRGHKDGEHC